MSVEHEAIRERLTALLTVAEIAKILNYDESAIYHKFAGRRRWSLDEALLLTDQIREHKDASVTVETLFGADAKLSENTPTRTVRGTASAASLRGARR